MTSIKGVLFLKNVDGEMKWKLFLIIILVLEGIYFLTEFLFS